MKEKIIRCLYVNIVLNQIEREKVMRLNRNLGPIPISLRFYVRLVLGLMFKAHHAPKEARCIFQQNKVRFNLSQH